MAQYGIKIEEILRRTVIVEADNLEEAIEKVQDAVWCDEIVLDADDYADREIEPSDNWSGGIIPEGADVSYYWHLGDDKMV